MSRFLEITRAQIARLDEQLRARSLRERGILAVGALACVFLLIDHVALQSVSEQRRQVERTRNEVDARIEGLEVELASFARREPSPEQRQRDDEIRQLEAQLAQIESRLAREIGSLVPPEAIVSLLEEILAQVPDLLLVRVESQPPQRIGRTQPDADASAGAGAGAGAATAGPSATAAATILQAGPRLFRHGLEIEVEGSYPATLEYLERLEASRWSLLWDRFELEVVEFPKARVRIELHTISADEEWIGV